MYGESDGGVFLGDMMASAQLASLYSLLDRFQAGARQELESDLRVWQETAPDNPLVWNLHCAILRDRHDWPLALALMQKAVRLLPNDPSLGNNLALVLDDNGLFSEAEALLRRLRLQYPGLAQIDSNLGNSLLAQGKDAGAEIAYLSALKKQPDFQDAK